MSFKELKHNIRILRWIKDSKRLYTKHNSTGMCIAFNMSRFKPNDSIIWFLFPLEKCITKHIPEYTRENFGVTQTFSTYWWDIKDKTSRIKAFDKLISIYKKKLGFIGKFF